MKDSQPSSDMQVRRKALAMLHVPLSTNEVADMGRQLANLHGEVDKLEAERKASNDTFKARIDILEIQLAGTAAALRTGTKEERGELAILFDYERCNVSVRRADNGELVSERTLTAQERQLEFASTRVPGALLDVSGRVYELVDDRSEDEKAGKAAKKAKVVALKSVEKKADDNGIVENEPAVAPVSAAEPAPAEDDKVPELADADDPPFGREQPAEAAVTPLRLGDAVWLADGEGLAVGPKMIVEEVAAGVQKGVVWITCKHEGSEHRDRLQHQHLSRIPPREKKTRATKKVVETFVAAAEAEGAVVSTPAKTKKPKPKFTQGAMVLGPRHRIALGLLAICSSQVLSDGVTVMYVAQSADGEKLSFREDELTSPKARKPRASKAAS